MKKMNEEQETDLNSLPATKEYEKGNAIPKNDNMRKKIGNPAENVGEGSLSQKKKKKKKTKKKNNVKSDETEKVKVSKLEMDEKSLQGLPVVVMPKHDSKMTESCKETDLEENKIKKKKKRKIKRWQKKCLLSGNVDMDKNELQEAMQELTLKVKHVSTVKIEEDNLEVDTEMSMMKRKKEKKSHELLECNKMDTKPLEDNLQDLSVIEKPEAVQQAVKTHGEVSAKKKKVKKKVKKKDKKKQLNSSGNGDANQSQLKSNLENTISNTPGNALLTCKNNEEMNATDRRKLKEHDGDGRHKKLLEEGSMELHLPVGDAIKKFGFQDGTNKECISTQIVLDLPKRVPVSCRRKKLLVLDLNGLLLDVMMVVPPGYKAEEKIGQKSVFKRPFCDDFLNFCFERFEVGVWTSRIKKNMDDVVGFLMADTKHKLLFCWDQSHCTMTGINTINNRHKPLVCKELRKLWDKHEPTLPWEKGEYNESNTLLLDDSPHKALLNPPNTAIFPHSYSLVDMNDNSLGPEGDIRLYLEGLATAEHVQEYVKQHPFGQHAITSKSTSWGFYCRVLDRFKLQLY